MSRDVIERLELVLLVFVAVVIFALAAFASIRRPE